MPHNAHTGSNNAHTGTNLSLRVFQSGLTSCKECHQSTAAVHWHKLLPPHLEPQDIIGCPQTSKHTTAWQTPQAVPISSLKQGHHIRKQVHQDTHPCAATPHHCTLDCRYSTHGNRCAAVPRPPAAGCAAAAAAYAAMTLTATGAAAGTSSDMRGWAATKTCKGGPAITQQARSVRVCCCVVQVARHLCSGLQMLLVCAMQYMTVCAIQIMQAYTVTGLGNAGQPPCSPAATPPSAG